MKNPDILHPLNACGAAIETAFRTTIHLINDNIFTDHIVAEDDDDENVHNELTFDAINS